MIYMEKILEEYPIKIIQENNTINNNPEQINIDVEEIFVINLDTDVARRTYIKLLMKKLGISYRLIIARKPSQNLYNKVRAYQNRQSHILNNKEKQEQSGNDKTENNDKIENNDKTENYNNIKPMSIGEVGCYLTQMWCLRYIIKNNIKSAIILEDDIVIHKSWNQLFNKYSISKNGSEDINYDFLLLGAADHGFNRGNSRLIKNGIYIPKHHVIMGTHAIFYSHYGASKIFQHRLQRPEYFDRNMRQFFTFFDQKRCGVCYPNIFTVENSTTNLYHNFGIAKYKYNDYYYRECYGRDFSFKDYYFIYLDIFEKASMLDIGKYRSFDSYRFMRLLLMNYFNNDHQLCNHHIKCVDTDFFNIADFFSLIMAIKQARPYDRLYYRHHFEFCKANGITPAELMRNPDYIEKYREKYWCLYLSNTNNSPLFHKQSIDQIRSIPSYEIIEENQENDNSNNTITHLHCYDLSKFEEIYGEYLERIIEFSKKVVLTYSVSNIKDLSINSINSNNLMNVSIIVLKVPNYGYDIGAKFSAIQYLQDINQQYDYIFFLHSKSCEHTRRIYFNSLINNLSIVREKIHEQNNSNDKAKIGGFFPPTIHQGNNTPIIYDNKYLFKNDLSKCLYHEPNNNKIYIDELMKYLYSLNDGIENGMNCSTIWPSGNCYILHRQIAEKLFRDETLYGCLNGKEDFDYNWVRLFYRIPHESVKFVYEYYRENGLCSNNHEYREKNNGEHGYPDMMVEHAFERIVFRVIWREKMGLQILPNEKNREQILEISNEISNRIINVF